MTGVLYGELFELAKSLMSLMIQRSPSSDPCVKPGFTDLNFVASCDLYLTTYNIRHIPWHVFGCENSERKVSIQTSSSRFCLTARSFLLQWMIDIVCYNALNSNCPEQRSLSYDQFWTWEFPMSPMRLSSDLSLHKAASCRPNQISRVAVV